MEYARHHFITVWQAYRRKIVVQNLPKDFMTTEWDFAENYTMIHNNAIQSKYWNQSQLTLSVSLTHYWDPKDQDNMLTDVHIYLSGDRKHDTSFVQLAMTHHGKLYCDKLNAARVKHNLCKLRGHLVNSDGAASHFKNKYTFKYMISYSKKVFPGMKCVAWETCAPSHGKGPHDGLGAVIKTLLRRRERQEKWYLNSWADAYIDLNCHYESKSLSSLSWYAELESSLAPPVSAAPTQPSTRSDNFAW